MNRLLASSVVAATVALVAPQAHAKPPVKSGTLVVGIDRLFGLQMVKGELGTDEAKESDSRTTISLLGGEHLFTGEQVGMRSYEQIPRLTFDIFITAGFSFGLGLMYQMSSSDHTLPQRENIDANQSYSTKLNYFLVAPRLGWGTMFGKHLGLWGHVGATDVSGTAEQTEEWEGTDAGIRPVSQEPEEFEIGATYLNLDLMVLVAPSTKASFGFMLGPTYDHALRYKQDGEDEASYRSMGVQAGIMGWF